MCQLILTKSHGGAYLLHTDAQWHPACLPFTRISIRMYKTESLSMVEPLLSSVVHINSESAGYQLNFRIEVAVFL